MLLYIVIIDLFTDGGQQSMDNERGYTVIDLPEDLLKELSLCFDDCDNCSEMCIWVLNDFFNHHDAHQDTVLSDI